MCFWLQNTECLTQEDPDAEDNSLTTSLADEDVTAVPAPLQAPFSVSQPKDLIRCLPPHLSMYILGLLDQKSLKVCAAVSRCWAFLAKEVKRERACQSAVQVKIQYLQGLCPRGVVVNYAKTVDVTIPQLNEEGDVVKENSHKWRSNTKEEGSNLQAAYHDLKTDTILLEERNVFCGSYNIRILMDQSDQSRKIHYSGGNLVAIGSADRKVRLLDMSRMKEVPLLLSGHAGSIKAPFLDEKRGFVLSGSFDLSIRCWDIHSGACVKIFSGHCGTITCLDLHEEQFVSGGRDGLVKVWNLVSGKCLKTLKHHGVVQAVKMNSTHVVSGSDRGLVKIWCAATSTLIKILEGHQGPVKCLCFDRWHLVTGGTDGYVLGWSMLGNLKRCLIALRHPKEVLSLEFLYLRVISGCADGKIWIFNFLTGSCLRVLLASSSGNPISAFCVAGNRMVVNSPTTLLMFQFEEIGWDYTLDADREMVGKKNWCKRTSRRAELQPHRLTREMQDADQLELPCWTCCCSPKSCGTSPALCRELMQSAACQQQQHSLQMETPFLAQAEQQKESFPPGMAQARAFARDKSARARSARIPAAAGGKPEHGPPLYAPAHPDRAEAAWQHVKRRGVSCPVSPDKVLLTVSMLQNACKAAPVSSRAEHAAKIREAWEPPLEHQQHCPEKVRISKTPLQHKEDQVVRLQQVSLHSDSLTVKRISVPFETKRLRLKLKNSLHGPAVSSSIPVPTVVRPKTCGLPREKEAGGGRGKVIPHPEDGVQLVDPFMASERIKLMRVTAVQMKTEAVSRRKKPFCPYAADPFWSDSEFRLLMGKWKEEYEAAPAAQYWAHQVKLGEDQQKARKKAWLRKTKGLPTDSFTEEGKIPAPELGFNTFI